ncbi:MAG: hypothetical protein M3030_08755, partial [Bombella apis]|nr:hypothetical protein [Bombella apis]
SGGNDLLKQNQAILVEQVQDILSALADTPSPDPGLAPWSRPPSRQPSLFTPTEKVPTAPPAAPRKAPAASQSLPESDEKNILSLLAHTPSTVDEIASRCQLSISAVAAILIELEMNGAVQRHDDGQITLPS